jgi:hypothetical protein
LGLQEDIHLAFTILARTCGRAMARLTLRDLSEMFLIRGIIFRWDFLPAVNV